MSEIDLRLPMSEIDPITRILTSPFLPQDVQAQLGDEALRKRISVRCFELLRQMKAAAGMHLTRYDTKESRSVIVLEFVLRTGLPDLPDNRDGHNRVRAVSLAVLARQVGVRKEYAEDTQRALIHYLNDAAKVVDATKKHKEKSNALLVEPKHAAASATAAKKDKSTNANNASETRRDQLRALIRPEMDWAIVWPTLKDNGWVAKPGRGLVSWYLSCPEFATKSVSDMMRHAKRGQDYFCSSDDLRQYCVDELGWVGYEIRNNNAEDDAVDEKGANEPSRVDGTAGTVDQLRQLITPDMHWVAVMTALKASGWAVKPGRGLVTYYYCNSKFANDSVSNMLARGVRNEDYFCSSQELKDYCRAKYGWNGDNEAAGSVVISRDVQESGKRAPAPKKIIKEAQKKRAKKVARRKAIDGRKRQRKKAVIDLTEDASDPIEPHGREQANHSLAKLSEELANVTREKDEIQKELKNAKEDSEDKDELLNQQLLATDIWQGRFEEAVRRGLAAGVDAKVFSDIRDRPLSSGR